MENEEIVKEYKSGKSAYQIANENDNISTTKVYYWLKKYNVPTRSNKQNSRKYEYNKNFFDKIDSSKKAYWLGFIYADGFIASVDGANKRFGVALGNKDKEHLKLLKKDMDATYPVKTYKANTGYGNSPYCRLQIFGDNIHSQLKKHGVTENKTDSIEAPQTVPSHLKHHFIRGYFDGDGSITGIQSKANNNKKNYKVRILGTTDMLNYIKDFIERKGIATVCDYSQRKNDNNTFTLEMGGNIQTKLFLDAIYDNAQNKLKRKYRRYLNLNQQIKETLKTERYNHIPKEKLKRVKASFVESVRNN